MISYIVAYGASFLSDTIEKSSIERERRGIIYSLPIADILYKRQRTYGLPVADILNISSACERPFKNIAYAFQLSSCLSYQVKANRKIAVLPLPPPKDFQCSKTRLALSFLLVIPLKIVSIALKILLFLFSDEFRKMQNCLVQEHLLRTKKFAVREKISDFVLGIPRDVLANYGHLFSVQDLGRLEQVNKDLYDFAPKMWRWKAKELLSTFTDGDPKQAIKEKFLSIELLHDKDFIKALGGEERIYRFPVPVDSRLLSETEYQQLKEYVKEDSIVRSGDYFEFLFYCQDTERNEKDILFIGKREKSEEYLCMLLGRTLDEGSMYRMNFESLNKLFRGQPSEWTAKFRSGKPSDFVTLQLV